MGYLVGLLVSLATVGYAVIVGIDRERAFYPPIAIVVASFYVLFATMGASNRTLVLEIAAGSVFLVLATIGYKRSLWLVAIAIFGHGVFDFFHHFLIDNPGMPHWWPAFCMTFDVVFGAWMFAHLWRHKLAT